MSSNQLQEWDKRAAQAAKSHPLKVLTHLPSMPGITEKTARNLKWKSLRYLLGHDTQRVIPRFFFKKPLRYLYRLIRSALRKESFVRDGDFFLYGCKTQKEFQSQLSHKNSLLILGFSYCHKPFECPSGRFTDSCIHALDNPVCQQCFIGKTMHCLPKQSDVIPLFIPTIHYIGEKVFEIAQHNPHRKILFLITACELTLKMFGDWGNMVNIQGIGVRLDGRICNTMEAFELSERGIKPGLTVVLPQTQQKILDLLSTRFT